MSIANKLDFASYPTITVLSQQNLEEKYRQVHPWRPWVPSPSPLSLLKFYIEREKPKHVMVDEVPLETGNMFQLFGIRYLVLGFGIVISSVIIVLVDLYPPCNYIGTCNSRGLEHTYSVFFQFGSLLDSWSTQASTRPAASSRACRHSSPPSLPPSFGLPSTAPPSLTLSLSFGIQLQERKHLRNGKAA